MVIKTFMLIRIVIHSAPDMFDQQNPLIDQFNQYLGILTAYGSSKNIWEDLVKTTENKWGIKKISENIFARRDQSKMRSLRKAQSYSVTLL